MKCRAPEKEERAIKIVLFAINGSHAHSCLAVRCLADALAAANFTDVTIKEATLRDRTGQVLEQLVAENAAFYGFACYIWNIEQTLALAADLRAILPDAKIVFGGPECSYDEARFASLPFVDCVITGEGEDAIVTAARAVAAGSPLPKLLCGTPDKNFPARGIHYRKGETLPPLVYYESSRGCPFSCAFCLSSATAGVRAKTAEKTLADLAEFEAFPGDFTVKLVDRTFNFDRERAKTIWRGLLDETYTKCYHFEVCASLLDEESFAILSRFPKGKVRLEIGLQSIHPETLAAVSRHTDAAAVLAAASQLTRSGAVHIHLDLIAGLPFETFTGFGNSFDAAYFACDVLQLGFLKLLHGTALREHAAEYGIVFSEKPPYTVLKTADISFEELAVLHRVDELLERLRDSGRFVGSLDFLLPRLPSPFAFYCGFAGYLKEKDGRELQKITQRELFSRLAAYGKTLLDPKEHGVWLTALRTDFAAHEVRRPPRELLGEEETKKGDSPERN